jgi:hypothetical protein
MERTIRMKSPKMLVSATARAEAQYQATLVGLAVRQALAEHRAIVSGRATEPQQPLQALELPDV